MWVLKVYSNPAYSAHATNSWTVGLSIHLALVHNTENEGSGRLSFSLSPVFPSLCCAPACNFNSIWFSWGRLEWQRTWMEGNTFTSSIISEGEYSMLAATKRGFVASSTVTQPLGHRLFSCHLFLSDKSCRWFRQHRHSWHASFPGGICLTKKVKLIEILSIGD